MTTLSSVSPGEPVVHLDKFPKGGTPNKFQKQRSHEDGLEERIVENLASNVTIIEALKNEE